ncbi:RtcB family protein [Endozoicomonas elysicola]|uniref:RtcB family protein n=1 Tax=Endozoicomonas elysicola TaxID=305900 RepID=UPI00037E02E2|nr:RtcB family protein [Endozoicomonas elysicola]
MDDLARQTAGIERCKDKGILDEIPSVYKNIDKVMSFQKDMVEVVHTLKQIINIID